MPTERWKRRPEGSNWGDFGPDDQLGRINLLTPHCVRQAAAEVVEGLTFCLSLPLDVPGENLVAPYRHALILRPGLVGGAPNMNRPWAEFEPGTTDVVNDDLALVHTQGSTQWDSLCHVGQLFDADDDGVPEIRYYNGFRGGADIDASSDPDDAGYFAASSATSTRIRALGIGGMAAAGAQGRGVLIDLAAHYASGPTLIGHAELMAVLEADGIEIEEGDMVCLHTGYAQRLLDAGPDADILALMATTPALDGRDPELQAWIRDTGIATLAADNAAVEAYPPTPAAKPSAIMPLHELCLFKLGIHLGELWLLTPLANWLRANGRHRFLLTARPLRMPAAGSPVSAIATV